MIKAILFDLDGTLLPMDLNEFTKAYAETMTEKFAVYGYDSKKFYNTIFAGISAMVKNDGQTSNEAVFFENFTKAFGREDTERSKPIFNDYYLNDFRIIKDYCGYDINAKKTIDELKNSGYRIILATNPFFPYIATETRVRWAGLVPEDFEFITTYENSYHCKPNPEYYGEVLSKANLKPSECLMVGNDVNEDMIAETLGINVFLTTKCLINRDNRDISVYNCGDLNDLVKFIKQSGI